MSMQKVGSFKAQDADGKQYTIGMYREKIDTTHLRSKSRESVLGSLLTLQTDQWHHVNRIDKGSYEILHPNYGTIPITSDDPQAP